MRRPKTSAFNPNRYLLMHALRFHTNVFSTKSCELSNTKCISTKYQTIYQIFIDNSNDYTHIPFEDEIRQMCLNPLKPNGISHPYQLDQSISILWVVWWYFSFLFKF